MKVNYLPMRSLCAKIIGSLVSVKAIVVRTTDVKPYLKVACYACDVCGNEIYQLINSKAFLPIVDCPSSTCKSNQNRGRLYQQTRASKFVSFQELRVQEPSDQVPIGHVPRSMTIIAMGECVKQASPGDMITVHGIYLPTVIAMSRSSHKSKLLHETYIEAFKIMKQKPSYRDTSMNENMISMIEKNKENNKDIFSSLAKSIAPEIYGLEDIKKALLILLVGGVNIDMNDGMKIRGNLNILLLGDPGVAKSQILKFIANISPRGVYTTGKGSSGVGLTAAILKDPISSKKKLI
jgi:DNA replication licensing factor MCM7